LGSRKGPGHPPYRRAYHRSGMTGARRGATTPARGDRDPGRDGAALCARTRGLRGQLRATRRGRGRVLRLPPRPAGGRSGGERGRPWTRDTAPLVFSSTKGLTAACVLRLVERGVLDLAAPVAAYWPEFAAGGKAHIPLGWVLCHRAGVPVVDAPLTLEQVLA